MNIKERRTRKISPHKRMIRSVISVLLLFMLLLPQAAFAAQNDIELPDMPLPGQQKELRGDADGNGVVNYADALLVLRCSIGLARLTNTVITRCDVDGRKGLTYADALLILRYSIGLETKL